MSDSLPDELPEAPDPAELPAAAQWMMVPGRRGRYRRRAR